MRLRAVPADNGKLPPWWQADLIEPVVEAQRHQFIGQDECGGSLVRWHRRDGVGNLMAAALIGVGAKHQVRVKDDPPLLQCISVGVDEDITQIGVIERGIDADSAVPFADQSFHTHFRHAFEVQIQPGMPRIGQRPAQGNKGYLAVRQIVDAMVLALGGRNDQRVGKTPGHHALHISVGVFFRRTEQGDKVQLVARKDRLDTVEHAHEEHIALAGDLRARLHHEADNPGGATAQGPAGLVWHVAHGIGGFQHTSPSLFVHVRFAIQGTRNRADRQVETLR